MSQQNRHTIIEKGNGFYIKVPWSRSGGCGLFGIIAFFICVALILAYKMHHPGFPIILYIFPVFIACFGFPFLPIALRYLFNNSHINIENNLLQVFTSPMPGNSPAVYVPVDRIGQFYTSEEPKKTEDQIQTFYNLNVRLIDGTNYIILENSLLNKDELIELEEHLEKFLGIQSVPVKGEVDSVRFIQSEEKIKRKKRITYGYHPAFANKHVDDEVLFDGIIWSIVFTNQYDWFNTHIDKQFYLLNPASKNICLYIKQNKGLHEIYVETKLDSYKSNSIVFDYHEPQSMIDFDHVSYQLVEAIKGNSFINNEEEPVQIQQWFYKSVDEKRSLRINRLSKELQFFQGDLYSERSDEEQLDLNISLEKLSNQTDENDLV